MINSIKNKNFIWNSIGLSFNAFTSLAFLVIVKLINGSNIGGIFTYSFSLAMLFYVASNYYNRPYQVSNYNDSKTFNQYLTSRIIFSIITIVMCLVFLLINHFSFTKNVVIILLVLLKIIESISDCFFAFFQSENDLYKSGISYTLKSIIGVGIFTIADLITRNICVALVITILAEFLVFIFYDYKQYLKYNHERIRFDTSNMKLIIIEAFPIFIFSFLSIYTGNLQKYVLTYFASDNIQMIFGILIMPSTMMILIGSYIIMPFVLTFKNYYKNSNKSAFKKLSIYICIALFVSGLFCEICAYFLGIPVLNIIYNAKLNDYLFMLLIVIFGSIFTALCMVISNILTVLEKNRIQLIPYAMLSVIGTIVSIILINKYKLTGACYSYLIVSCGLFLCFIIIYAFSLNGWKEKK